MSVSKFWNIGIGGQSNIGNWSNINEFFFMKITVSVSKKRYQSVSNIHKGDSKNTKN